MDAGRVVTDLLAVVWIAAGIVLGFDIGHLPYRLLNRGRTRQLEESAITPLYWRAWGAILAGAGVALLLYALSGAHG
ncbi:MAG: hypothetical protein E6J29_13090 [Chloroflexi bacterium]|nr:MAG: hypothetical protein E6J29_13090 [Chloroflexota bacterium]